MVPPTQLPLVSRASSRSSPATANSFSGAFASPAWKSATLISVPLRFFIRRPSFRLPKKTTAKLPDAVARRSWVLRGVNYAGVAEEARTRGFVPPAFAGFALVAAALLVRSEEHTSELQSQSKLVCRLLLEKKKAHHC